MKDIVGVGQGPGQDLRLFDAQSPKGASVLQVQLGSLEYAPDFGIDLDFFLSDSFQFQNESFRAYLIQRLTELRVNVAEVEVTLSRFVQRIAFTVGDPERGTTGEMIR